MRVFLLSISLHPSDFPGLRFCCNIYVLARDQVDFFLSNSHRARKDIGCESNVWYGAFVASILDEDGNIKMSNCCIHLPNPRHTYTSVQGANQQVYI